MKKILIVGVILIVFARSVYFWNTLSTTIEIIISAVVVISIVVVTMQKCLRVIYVFLHRQNRRAWISRERSFTWISCERSFTWISREMFTWNLFHVNFTWNSFHVHCRWIEFHMKFSWNMHLHFMWILWVEIYSRVSISGKKIKWKKIAH